MKTIKVLIILFVLLCGPWAGKQNLYSQSAIRGVILELSGTVELRHAGAADFSAASIGDQLFEDTVISTGFSSNALIEIGSTIINVRPLTRLNLTEISASSGVENININLQAGRVRVDVSPPAGTRASMTVTSPSATASVRGTGFYFDGRNLRVDNGVVGFSGRRGYEIPVGSGFISSVQNNNSAGSSFYTGTGSSQMAGSDSWFTPGTQVGYDASSASGTSQGVVFSGSSVEIIISY